MSSYLQIISCETADSSPSILVATENERFLFNSGDGSQRLCCEHRVRLAKMENVFLTHVGADATGGLPGMLLTIADIGRRALRLHGPPGIGRFMHATRHFMRRPDFAVTCVEGVESLCTKQLSVHKILVEGGPSSSPTHKRPRSSSTLSPTRKGLQSFMCYIAEVPPSPGRFLVDRAKELGVPQGPLYGKLKSGCSVTLGDGRVVKPESVVAPAVPGCAAAIIACPSVDLVDAMTSHPGWAEWLEGGAHCKSKSRLSVMAHFASSDVVHSDAYLRWCAQWGEGITHLFLGRGLCGGHTPYVASLSSSLKLHRLCPQIFPIPQQHGGNSKQHSTVFSKVSAAPLSRYWMAPHHKIGLDESASLDAARVQSAASDRADQDWKDAACVGQSDFESATSAVTDPSKSCMRSDQLGAEHPLGKTEGAELAFLGTGSSQPSKYRNVSGIYLKLGLGHAGMLLDAGEGSMGQLWRLFGSDDGGAKDVLTGLQAVWISHPHADHHLGLVRVLTERLRLGLDPLILMAPLCVHRWLEEYAELDPLVSGTYRFVDVSSMMSPKAMAQDIAEELERDMGISQCWNVPVNHCRDAYAFVMHSSQGWKLVYSGDTRPCDQLVDAGAGATILIHEATFDDSMELEARSKRHSTTSEAVDIGKRMGAYRTILTHFSQRYPKLPPIPMASTGSATQVCVAFDLMKVPLASLEWMPTTLPALQWLFPGDDANSVSNYTFGPPTEEQDGEGK